MQILLLFSHITSKPFQWPHLVWTAEGVQTKAFTIPQREQCPRSRWSWARLSNFLNLFCHPQIKMWRHLARVVLLCLQSSPTLWWESPPPHTHEVWHRRMTLTHLHLHLPGAAFLWVHFENGIVCQGQFWLLSCSSLLVTLGCHLGWNHTQHSHMCIQPMPYHIKAILNFTVTAMENRKTGRMPGRRKR